MKDVKSPGECQKTSQDFNESFCPLALPLLGLVLMLNCNVRVVGTSVVHLWVMPGSLGFYVVISCNFYKFLFDAVRCIWITSFVISRTSHCAVQTCVPWVELLIPESSVWSRTWKELSGITAPALQALMCELRVVLYFEVDKCIGLLQW